MSFAVIPAIDLRGGRCVRLHQGDYARETAYSDDPAATAQLWQDQGAPRLHVVDLDGAREGRPVNTEAIRAICRAVSIPVEVSGGIRTLEAIRQALADGADRVQLGSIAVKDPAVAREAIRTFGEAIVIAIDARDGFVRTDGWLQGSNIRALDLARDLDAAGVARIMFTDISRDGTLSEPNFQAYRDLLAAVSCPVVASGGIATLDHLRQLAAIGCEGAIVGTSLYERRFTLPEALAAVATV
ncbi:1-(5-phosphoribosyl)-5-[(5-phosphoribosylamino)methylideneamino]imidazole-4-carboxamide isomerase [Tepidiforma sp.]|uniref:1-(5-phosphoribosyl)-5-[(5- phosphoribosylamino)methylideneamino]imidazole-4- carboxamide isomerase n=1 Tax=Tepidiforma sp. TaxID=2682230 RepID=UPI002ADE8AE8|nr:1-(5-phosphoribosyl)-5-[(5-phosphoribosylamino)methylideneamino]imidazole-4-carboxamide isomerase [Tepidiforma sp.]